MAWNTPRTWVVGEMLTAALFNTQIRDNFDFIDARVLGYAQATADQTGITTETDLTGLSVTVTVGTSRRIRVTGHGLVSSSVAQDDVIVYIKEGTSYHQRATQQTMPVANRAWSYEGSVILTPSAGSHTYKLSAHRNQGTGTVIHYAAAGYPAFILAQDIGKA